MDLRASDGVLKLQTDEAALERGRCTAISSTTPGSAGAPLWIIVALASVLCYGAGKTHIYPVYFWVLFDDHEAITTLSRGRAALRGENGRSPRKAPPGPRSSAPTTTP